MKHAIIPVTLASLLAACFAAGASAQTATAALAATAGNATAGTVTFAQKGDKMTVSAKVSGLPPGAPGCPVHEKGDCSAAEQRTSAGFVWR